MNYRSLATRCLRIVLPAVALSARIVSAQPASPTPAPTPIERIAIAVGRSLPIDLPNAATQITITNPEIADAVVLNERSIVLNAKAIGETDILLSGAALGRRHLRVAVYTATDRRQIALGLKFAEVRRDALVELGVSAKYTSKSGNGSVGTGDLATGINGAPPVASLGISRFVSGLATFGTTDLLAYIDAQQRHSTSQPNV